MKRTYTITVLAAALLIIGSLFVPTAGAEKPMSPQMVLQVMAVAGDVDPQLAERLEKIRREKGQRAFARALSNSRHLVALARLKEEDRPLYDVKVGVLRAGARGNRLITQLAEARRTGSPSADVLEAQLRELATEQVGLEIAARGLYIIHLTDRIVELEENLQHDGDHYQETIDRRWESLLERVDRRQGPTVVPIG